MKKLISAAVISVLVAGCSQTEQPKQLTPETDLQKQSYSLGAIYSTRITQDLDKMGEAALDIEMLRQGFNDGLDGKAQFTEEQLREHMMAYQQKIQAEMAKQQQAVSDKTKAEGAAYIVKMMEEDAEIKLAESGSGLAYKVLEAGDGENSPKAEDTVTVHYTGTLIDGTKFDSSVDRGQPIDFPLNRVIPGWTEGVQLMTKGAKFRFFIPSDIAYGDAGSPPVIPGGATLVFDVELIDFTPFEAPKAESTEQ